MNIEELKEEYGEAELVTLTQTSLKELSKGLPIHCGDVILVPPDKFYY